MSDDTGQNSLLGNLKNKIAFNLHKATYDPDANKFVKEQVQITKEKEEAKKQQEASSTDDKKDQGDPNKFSGKRLVSKVGNQTLDILQKIFFPFLALMLAMIVTNEMIIYAAPVRLIFFIFTFLICFIFKYVGLILGIYYLFKGGYSYYVNNMTDKPKQDIMPTIFALLPLTTTKYESKIVSFLMYPFTYPKTEKGESKLPVIMKQYWEDLQESFPGLDKIENIPIFVEKMKKIKNELEHLHEIKNTINKNANNTNNQKNQNIQEIEAEAT